MKFFTKVGLIVLNCMMFGCGESTGGDTEVIAPENPEQASAIYMVNKEQLSITLESGEEGNEDYVAWEKIVETLPNHHLKKYVSEYHVFSDGEDETLAYVTNTEDDDEKWIFSVDYLDSSSQKPEYIKDFIATIIHEYFHIMTLHVGEVDRDYEQCGTYKIDEGCVNKSAVLNKFYEKFWQEKTHQEHKDLAETLEGEEKDALVADFYDIHKDEFVSEYASTNPVEDLAESLTWFVLSDKATNIQSIKDKKRNFFYQFPELVETRNYIRQQTDVRK